MQREAPPSSPLDLKLPRGGLAVVMMGGPLRGVLSPVTTGRGWISRTPPKPRARFFSGGAIFSVVGFDRPGGVWANTHHNYLLRVPNGSTHRLGVEPL